MSAKRHPKRTDEEWMNLIQECRSSGLSDRVWCAEHRIHTSNFYYHIRRLRKLACEIPESSSVSASPKQEVVRVTFDEPAEYSNKTLQADDSASAFEPAIRIQIHEIRIEISNSAASDTVFHTLSVLQKLC